MLRNSTKHNRIFNYLLIVFLSVGVFVLSTSCSGGGSSSSGTSSPSGDVFVPPDPATIAPANNSTVAVDFTASTEFLYSGNNPVQRGVVTGTIDKNNASVIRGLVLDRMNTALSGVKITILNHPEYGYTYSRDDGKFDMVVNGGEILAINYEQNGYMTLQRNTEIPEQDYTVIDNVVMTPYSTKVTEVNLQTQTTPFSVVEGEVTNDARGERKATVLFPKTATVQMIMPDGTTQSLNGSMHVRATEYTAGDNGPSAMPAELPDGVAYTYCVELSIDEAKSAGATGVTFSQPVINYVENFQNFPVGDIVPTYYYDKQQGKWIRTEDGKVIAIVSITNSLADIDIDNDGVADDVTAIGITDDERKNIATLYQAGTELWRTPISHFTPIDHNWPEPPVPNNANENEPDDDSLTQEDPEEGCEASGSIIECQKRALGERVPIVGTPLTLNYRSKRTRGDLRNQTLYIQLTKEAWLYTLEEIQLELTIAGQKVKTSFEDFSKNMIYKYVWDGKDAYGRDVYGPQNITVKLSYIYYFDPENSPTLVTGEASSDNPVVGGEPSRIRMGPDYSRSIHLWNSTLVKQNTTSLGIEGWSLSSHHQLDTWSNELFLGNGQLQKNALPVNILPTGTITTIAGTGKYGYTGDGDSALNATFSANDIAVGNDNSIYISDIYNHVVRKIDPDGTMNTIAGTGDDDWHYAYIPEQPALNAKLGAIHGINTAPDGSVYIINTIDDTFTGGTRYSSILKITPDGTISTVAGNNVDYLYTGKNSCDDYPVEDNEQATAGCLGQVTGLAVDYNGVLYISVGNHNKIRKVGLDGVITTIAGTGEYGYSGDGADAIDALIGYPSGLDVGKDGSIYFSSGNLVIRKITPEGIISTIAGSGTYGYSGDGGSALLADLDLYYNITVDISGNIYLPDGNSIIRRIDSRGIIDTIAGKVGVYSYDGDYGDIKDATFEYLKSVKIDSDNNLYILDGARIRKVSREKSTGYLGFEIPSKDLQEVYQFDQHHKHISTRSALDGHIKKAFTYNTDGYLTQIKDSYGQTTTIEYGDNAQVSAIISPYGQRTTLDYDANKHLTSITNPANEAWQFSYTDKGLVTAITKPNGHTSTYEYDQEGALTKATDAAGGTQTIERADISNGYEVSKTTKLARVTKYKVENLENGLQHLLNTMPGGLQFESNITRSSSSSIVITRPDGSVITAARGSDPRFGTSVTPFTRIKKMKMPSGLTSTVTFNKEVSLSDSNDPLSLLSQTDIVTINDNNYTQRYDNTTKTITSTSPEGRTVVTTFNPQGDVIKRVSGNLAAVDFNYNDKGKLTQIVQGDRTLSLAYNTKGYISSVTNPLNQTTNFTYDNAGRVIKQTFADLREIDYTYDANGNLLSITPPQKPKHDFIYSLIDKVEKYTPPSVAGTGSTSFSYNLDKQLTQITRPDGKTVDFSYDTAGRLSGVEDINYAYNTDTGTIATITDEDSETLSFSYDGSLLTQTVLSGTVAGTLSQTFNNDFRVSQQSINGANSIDYAYDRDGLTTKVGAIDITRDTENGYITHTALNTVEDIRTLNNLAQMQSYRVENNSTTVFNVNYTYDKRNRITQLEETVDGVTHSYNYSYDDASRLSGVSIDGVNTETYTYDANGNRLSNNGVTATYDNQDRLQTLGSVSYNYTANGELLNRVDGAQTTSYTYDLLGNLKSVALADSTQIDYLVDGLNRRVGKKVNGTLVQGFLYKDALNPIAELNADNNIVSQFIYASKSNVPDYMIKGGVTYRIISDHLGSPRLVINTASSEVVQRIDYDAWGNIISDTNPGFQPFGFAGGLYDSQTKLTRFGARDYDAQTGRWTAKDPIGFNGGDSNIYAYAYNNPINYFDPSGLISIGSIIDSIIHIFDDYQEARSIVDSANSAAETATNVDQILNDPSTSGPMRFLDLIDELADDVGNLMPVDYFSDSVSLVCGQIRNLTGPNGAITRHNNRLNAALNAD